MRLPLTTCVVPDGLNGGQLEVPSTMWRWQYGVDVIIPVEVVHQDGTAYSLAGAVAAVLAFLANDDDAAPALQLEWTITGSNTAEFFLPRSVAPLLPITDRGYATGIRFRDDDLDREDAILISGRATIAPQIGSFDLPVTTPPSTLPLAQGIPGVPVICYDAADVPDPTPDGLIIFNRTTGALQVACDGDWAITLMEAP